MGTLPFGEAVEDYGGNKKNIEVTNDEGLSWPDAYRKRVVHVKARLRANGVDADVCVVQPHQFGSLTTNNYRQRKILRAA